LNLIAWELPSLNFAVMVVTMTVKMVMLVVANAGGGDYHLKKQFHPLLAALRI